MWYNLITTYGSIKCIEEIFLNIILEKKRGANLQNQKAIEAPGVKKPWYKFW